MAINRISPRTDQLTPYTHPNSDCSITLGLKPGLNNLKPEKLVGEKSSSSSNFFGWLKKLFGQESEQPKKEKPKAYDPIDQDRMTKHLNHLKKSEAQRKDASDEDFDPLTLATEAGLERAWVKAQLAQITLRNEETILNQEEMLMIQETIQTIKAKLEDKMSAQLKEAKKTGLFNNANIASAALLIATTLVIAAVGVATGGTAPLVLVAIQGIAMGAAGSTDITKGVFKYRTDTLSAEILGFREKRSTQYSHLQGLLEKKKNASDAVAAGYKLARQLEDQRNQTIKGALS